MPESSKKSPTYSPPRRESISDHLLVLRRRHKSLGIDWRENLATTAFVRSLIKNKIINGPAHEGSKSKGAGVRSRFNPRDYRDLLEVIRLKSRGVKRRNAWILHLWLRGHDYPMSRVRTALVAEALRVADQAVREIAPTGRFRGDFNRRVQRVAAKAGKHGKHDDLLAFAYAMMVRPSEVRNLRITPAAVADLLCEGTALNRTAVQPVAESILESMKRGTTLDPQTIASLNEIFEQSPQGRAALQIITEHPEEVAGKIHGVYADDRGRSRLVTSLSAASDQALINARNWRSFIRSVSPAALRKHVAMVPPEAAERFAVSIRGFEEIRYSMFAHPDLDALHFMYLVDDEIPVRPPNQQAPVNADRVLDLLKSLYEKQRPSG